ncbi:DHHA1 domain-containing protein [Halococcus thailandensis]|uniref:Single-stranded DNA-specific exonuclease n=1 Tax=Halococcus thailandensis JCM 13552 TaxID=1227457 RepID=M0N9C1_9EURY|nr:DHH family phosphoesterase [Halococcus thailandensis]EMA54173.1 single-stranded DNA-specific exonuclease [Halococcus thailandensis JCM 13552]
MGGPIPALDARARSCAERLARAERVLLASHIDADGLTSAAIAAEALDRAAIPFETVFAKQLDPDAIAGIAERDFRTVLFTDFGSGQLDDIADHEAAGAFTPVVADHHQPADAGTEFHLNPLLEGLNGATELSGAGTTYVLARALGSEMRNTSGTASGEERSDELQADNRDLAALAVVGAVGDMQDSSGELVGANREIVAEGVDAGVLAETTDLALYGKQSRPLPKLLEYANDVRIPGISGSERGAIGFLSDLDIELERDGEWRRWVDLTADERQTVASALLQRAVARGVPANRIDDLVGTTYTLTNEAEGTELRDASEFSTLLNATARYDRADVGLAVCRGDRDDALDEARTLLTNHRKNLATGLDWVKEEGVTQGEHVQWFDAGEAIRETIVGIIAGMALGTDALRGDRPVIAFAAKNDTESKVSARGTHRLVRSGLDLSAVMGEVARALGGDGGGHDVAAGATIPKGDEEAFVERADAVVADQLG